MVSSARLWIARLIVAGLPESRCFGLKAALLRWAGATVGANVRIYSSAMILGNGALTIGDDVHVGPRAMIYPVAPAGVTIGSHVDIGPEAMILTGSHEVDLEGEHIAGKGTAASVTVGAGSWLGARSILLPGVTLAPKTLVAAGAVVTKSVTEEGTLVAGVPAVVKGERRRR